MTAITQDTTIARHDAAKPTADKPVVSLRRRTIDSVFIGLGIVVTAVLLVAGGLLMWGANFSSDYVHDELASQKIAFPAAAELKDGGRADLVKYAGATVDTGKEAEAYASFINGHLQGIADGQTYADLGTPEREAAAAVQTATDNGASATDIAALQVKADTISGQRNSLFKGETLRGLLLSAFAWSTVGRIAGIAAWFAFAAAAAMGALVALGMRHHHKVVASES